MKTTVELPDPLLRRAKIVAARRGATLKQLVVEGLEHVTSSASVCSPKARLTPEESEFMAPDAYGVPILKKRGKVVTDEVIRRIRDQLDI